jgi:AcrR family transcriptional regulator
MGFKDVKSTRNGESTRTAILDAAENLFAAASFDIVSMRDVAAKASVPLGLINYHFQSKEKLFEAIIARRSDELNSRRRDAFAALKDKPNLRQVLDVFLRPYLDLMLVGGPGWRAYGPRVTLRFLAWTADEFLWTADEFLVWTGVDSVPGPGRGGSGALFIM